MPEYSNDIINLVRARNAEYSRYAAPQWDALQYVLAVSNIPPDVAPDDYGAGKHISSAWNQWWTNHYESLMNSEYGRYTRADLDEQALRGFRDILRGNMGQGNYRDLIEAWLEADPTALAGYSTVVEGRMNNSDVNDKIVGYLEAGRNDLALYEVNRQLNEIEGVDPYSEQGDDLYYDTVVADKHLALAEADRYRQHMDESQKQVHPWFRHKDETLNFDFTSLDTYLYKLPGLLGSSSATIGTDTAAGLTAALLSKFGWVGKAAGLAIGTAAALYSREQESLGEVYSNYRDAIKKSMKDKKADSKVLEDARAYMQDVNDQSIANGGQAVYTDDQLKDEDYIYDKVLTNEIPIDNYQLNKSIVENRRGIQSLYMDNMALSAFDVAQTAIEILPFKFRDLARIKKVAAAAERFKNSRVGRVVTAPWGWKKALSDRIDDVVAYGLDKADDLSKLTWRKTVLDIGGRMALSSVLEGAEEGVQYIKGQNYINGQFDPDANIAERWWDNTLTSGRAIFAALTPFDPLYSDDKEFMDNFKGGALLGGIMTGGMRTVVQAVNMPGQIRANNLIAGLYADNLDIRDRLHKDVLYSSMRSNSQFGHLMQSFDYLKQIAPEGVTELDINEEMTRAAEMHSLRNSNSYLKTAEKFGIDPRTKDYDTYVALRNHYEESFFEANGNRRLALEDTLKLFETEKSRQYITQLTQRINARLNSAAGNLTPDNAVSEQTVRDMMMQVAYNNAFDRLADMFDQDGEVLKEILDKLNYKTNHTDVRAFGKRLRELKDAQRSTENAKTVQQNLDLLRRFGFTEDDFQIPTAHEEIDRAVERVAIAELDRDRYASEAKIFEEDGKETKDRIQRYKDAIDRSENYVVTLDDIANGRDINRANHNTTTYSPPTVNSGSNPNDPNNPLGPPSNPQNPQGPLNPQNPQNPPSPPPSNPPGPTPPPQQPPSNPLLPPQGPSNPSAPSVTPPPSPNLNPAAPQPQPNKSNPDGESKPVTLATDSGDIIVPSAKVGDTVRLTYNNGTQKEGTVAKVNRDGSVAVQFPDLVQGILTVPNTRAHTGVEIVGPGQLPTQPTQPVQPTPQAAPLPLTLPEPEAAEVTQERQNILNLRAEVTEEIKERNSKGEEVTRTILKRGTFYGDAYERASETIKDDWQQRHPNARAYREYNALNELNRLGVEGQEVANTDGQGRYDLNSTSKKYDILQELATARDRLEEHMFTYGNTKNEEAQQWADYVNKLVDDYNEIVSSEAKAAQQTKEAATKNPDPAPQPTDAVPTTPQKSDDIQADKVSDTPKNQGQFGLVSDERMEELRRQLRNKLNQLNSGIDPELLSIGLQLTAGYLDRGIKSFVDFSKVMIKDLGDAVRPYLKSFYEGARLLPEVQSNNLHTDMTPYNEVLAFDIMAFDPNAVVPVVPDFDSLFEPEGTVYAPGRSPQEQQLAQQPALQPQQPAQLPVQLPQQRAPQTLEEQFVAEAERRGVSNTGATPVRDPYSHELNYRLRDGSGQPIPFQGMEDYANNEELAEISTEPDFIQSVLDTGEFVIRPYTNPRTGQTSNTIYLIFEKNGKKYVTSVQEIDSLQRYLNNNHRLPYAQIQQILSNLLALRNKITQLCEQVKDKPNLKVVPVSITTTTGEFINEKNPDGSPKNKNLLESRFLQVKNPFDITPDDVPIGITTGNRGNMVIRYKGQVVSVRGQQLGQPMWLIRVPRTSGNGFDSKVAKLNYATFRDQPEVVDLIMDLLTTSDSTYISRNGIDTGIDPKKLLSFIVNYGGQTAVNPNDRRLNQGQLEALLDKQFYTDENGNVIIGRSTYTMSDLLTDDETRNRAKQYITDHFHWAIDEINLSISYIGADQGPARNTVFAPAKAALMSSSADKIIMIPGKLEFGLRDFGIIEDANGRHIADETHPNGISAVGWYIKQGVLLTDISDKLTNANMYVDDVVIADRNETPTQPELPTAPTPQPENPYAGISIDTPMGTFTGLDIQDIFDILDGKKAGPNLEVATPENQRLTDESQTMNAEQATQWLQDKLGVTPEIVPTVIEVTEAGTSVVGRVTEDSILLSEVAPIGTEYHEAWHRVSQLLISSKKRDKIYKKYRQQGLTDRQIDEMLAEDFRRFQLEEAQNYDFETKNWFRRIIDFVRLWSRTGSYALANIYNNINRAKYAGVQPSQENIERFRRIYSGEGPNLEVNGYKFQNISTVKQLDDITRGLEYAFFKTAFLAGQTVNYADLSTEQPRFDTLKRMLLVKQRQNPNPALQEVIDRYDDVFIPMLTAKLRQLGIRAIDRDESAQMAAKEEGASNVDIGQHTVESMNISIKDNAPAEVKFFFQTVPEYEIGADGAMHVKMDPITGFPQFVNASNVWIKVIKDLCGCRSVKNMFSKVMQLANSGDPLYQSLFTRFSSLIRQSASQDEAVAMNAEAMLTKIMTVITSDVNNFVTAKVSRDEQTQQVSLSLVDNTVDTKAMNYPRVWSQQLFTTTGLFKYDTNGVITSSPEARRRLGIVINNLKNIVNSLRTGSMTVDNQTRDLRESANLNIVKKLLIDQLNAVGIGIDMQTLNKMLSTGDFGNPMLTAYDAMRNFATNVGMYGGLSKIIETLDYVYSSINPNGTVSTIRTPQGDLNPRTIWNNLGFVKYMAQQYAETHATDKSLSSLGPDGSKYYMVSQNNFAKDRLNEIVNDPLVQAELSSVVYNQHSLLLQSAKAGNKELAIETLINFKDQTSQDTGRDYFGITDREDYMAKMAAVFADRILFPTVADKKTYHFIRGLKLFHEGLRLRGTPSSFSVLYGDGALNAILGYCYDELNQIELCLRQIDDDPNHVREVDGKMVHFNEDGTINKDWLEPSRRIKNFHTPNKFSYIDKNGKRQTRTVEGNGARFLFLTGIYTMKENEDGTRTKQFINFNDPMKSARENLLTAYDYFFNMSAETQKAFLSGIINERVKQEIQTAKDLGLITANDNNDVWSLRNVLLDSKELQKRIDRYRQFDPTNAEGFAIFDMLSDYTINSIVSIQEVEKMFSGAPAYYKVKYDQYGIVDVSIDKIKRLGALTSTGLNNRLDFTRDILETDEYTVAELKDHEIRDKQYAELERMFSRSNLKETIQEFNGLAAWDEVKDMSIAEIEAKYPEEARIALAAAKKDVAGYKEGINVADAAVYISPNMTRNLLRMRGIWSKEIKEAFDVLTNPETADTWESNPEQYAKANKVILNAMKYVAFGTRFNEIPGLGIPYFNKMALFPLFKSIATGDIKKLYDRMTAPGREIDMVLFDSAVKAGSRSPQKMYRQATDSEIELKDGQTVLSAGLTETLENDQAFRPDDLNKLVTYKQKYKYIRQQLETNPHTHEEQMLGTQFVKVGLSNLRDDDVYGTGKDTATGKQIKQTVMKCLNRLSDLGRQRIVDKIFDQNMEVDVTKLAKMLLDDARDSDANDNIISGLNVENGQTNLPLDAMSDNRWLESRFSAMIADEVVDVHLPGGAFIQRSAFGMEATAQDVVTENMINDGKPLLMINEKDHSMDSVVSINLFKHFIPNYEKMTFRQARQWLLKHNIIGLNAGASAIGYRIPTLSIASISALRFVDVFPEIMGDTIMLPEGFTKLTGSDLSCQGLNQYNIKHCVNFGNI